MDNDIGEDGLLPAFTLAVYDDADNDVSLIARIVPPDIRKHASLGLMYGLAILTLERMGAITQTIDDLLQDGPINEVDANNRIAALLAEDANELPI